MSHVRQMIFLTLSALGGGVVARVLSWPGLPSTTADAKVRTIEFEGPDGAVAGSFRGIQGGIAVADAKGREVVRLHTAGSTSISLVDSRGKVGLWLALNAETEQPVIVFNDPRWEGIVELGNLRGGASTAWGLSVRSPYSNEPTIGLGMRPRGSDGAFEVFRPGFDH